MENKAPKELHCQKKKGLGNMTKNALFVQKFDLCLKILLANNISILCATRLDLLMGAQRKS